MRSFVTMLAAFVVVMFICLVTIFVSFLVLVPSSRSSHLHGPPSPSRSSQVVAPQPNATTPTAFAYRMVNEDIYDGPGKTQIAQDFVVVDVPTESDIESELLNLYRIAKARRGFRYHNPATNIYIYIYGTDEQAEANAGLWIGMLRKSANDTDPTISISESRLAALTKDPEERFGFSEQERMQIFREVFAAENRATHDAIAQIPDSTDLQVMMRQFELENELIELYRKEVAERHQLTEQELAKISLEGVKNGWPH